MAAKYRYNLSPYNIIRPEEEHGEDFEAAEGILSVVIGGDEIPVSEYRNFYIDHKQDGRDWLGFTLAVDSELYRGISEETKVRYRGVDYLCKKISDGHIECEIDLDFLRKGFHETFTSAKPLSSLLADILPLGWTAHGAVLIHGSPTIELETCTDLDILTEAQTEYRCWFSWNHEAKICTVVSADAVVRTGEYVTDELNLRTLSFKGSSVNFCTRLYAYGKSGASIDSVNGGKKYIDDFSYSSKLIVGYFKCDYELPANILKAAQYELSLRSHPERSYECDVVDLAKLSDEYDFLDFQLHRTVTLIDTRRGINVDHRIVEYVEYPDEPERNAITLARAVRKMAQIKEDIKVASVTASNAVTAAEVAQTKASEAQSSADSAMTAAANAQTSADSTRDSLGNYVAKNELSSSIDSYVDSSSGKARITSSLSGTYQTVEGMSGYVKTTQLSADIGAYIDTQSGKAKITAALSGTFVEGSELELYEKVSDMSADIGAYIDTQAGTAKVVSACSGHYVDFNYIADYEKTSDLAADIGQYIDSQAGTAKIISSVSGTYQTKSAMADYAQLSDLDDYLEKTELNAGIETYIDTQAGTAKLTEALSGTFIEGSELDMYEKKSSLSADISAYIDTPNGKAKVVSACSGTYVDFNGLAGYEKKSDLSTDIGQYIDGTTGKAKIVSACSGTYQKKDDMSGYVTTTSLNTSIGQYIDSTTGKAKVVSVCSGTYAQKNDVTTEISQAVSPVESAISLTAAYGSGTIGSNVRALLQLVANADSSSINIKADKINFTGFTTFLKASDLGSGGSTSIDGGRILTGTISADRIDAENIKLRALYGSGTSYANVALLYSSGDDLYIGQSMSSSSTNVDMIKMRANTINIGRSDVSQLVIDNANKVIRHNYTANTANFDLGNSSHYFNGFYTKEIYCGDSSYRLKLSGAGIIPNTTSTSASYFQLGSSSYPFNDLYVKNLHVSGSFDLSGSAVKMGGTSSYYIEANTSRELKPSSSSATYPAYLGTSSIYWHYAYIGSNTVMIGSSGTASGSKLGFFGTTAVVRQSLSLTSNNMSYSSVTASNYLYALNNLIGILKKHGLISA